MKTSVSESIAIISISPYCEKKLVCNILKFFNFRKLQAILSPNFPNFFLSFFIELKKRLDLYLVNNLKRIKIIYGGKL